MQSPKMEEDDEEKTRKKWPWMKKEAQFLEFQMQSPKMEEDDEERRRRKKWPWMKEAQFLEFQMQALVYRYIEAGLRVPHHLVVTIWKSFALSSSSNYNHHSSPLLSVEHEPTRCRRTDGKKWRCSNTVLPFEKYCERHMHRGRKRSRKLVESSSSYDVVASSSASPTKKHDNTCGLDSYNETQSVPMSVSSNAQIVTIASLPSASDNVTRPSLVISESTNKGDKRLLPSVQKLFPEVSDVSLDAASERKNEIIARSREWKNMNVNGGLFPGIHFSPDTVLQDRGGFRVHRVETNNEPGRCRRTDGKKWRCKKDVLSGQKYCDKHMHRGIKKKHPLDTTNSHENAGLRTAARDEPKLSVSVMGIPLSRVSDEKSTSSCSSDTTITDTALRGGEDDNEEVLSMYSSGV